MTVLLMAASLMVFTIILGSSGPNTWALPVFLAVDVIILTIGLVFMWRARGH